MSSHIFAIGVLGAAALFGFLCSQGYSFEVSIRRRRFFSCDMEEGPLAQRWRRETYYKAAASWALLAVSGLSITLIVCIVQ